MRNLFFVLLAGVLCTASLSAQSDKPQGLSASSEQSTNATKAAPDPIKVVIVKRVEPVYPIYAQREHIQGQVTVQILISTAGDVAEVSVLSGPPALAESVVSAVKKWKFEPCFRGGVPVKVRMTLPPFDFAFTENVADGKEANAKQVTQVALVGPDGVQKILKLPQGVSEGLLLHKVTPMYPPAARMKRVTGTVVLAAIIAKDGRVKNLKVVSGPKELTESAIGAVQQWRYRPYLLEGEPVEVETQITVNYQLGW